VIFQKTESPQLALGRAGPGSEEHPTYPGLPQTENKQINSMWNGDAMLNFLHHPSPLLMMPCIPSPSYSPRIKKEEEFGGCHLSQKSSNESVWPS
jgi:hypothetical protein